MKKLALPAVLLLAPLLVSCASGTAADGETSAPPPPETDEVHWSYEGATGPDNWGQLSDEFVECSIGEAQSPVDLPDHADQTTSEPPTVTTWPTVGESVDTGHTIQLVPDGDASEVEWQDTTFDLAQVHFHMPSEHTIEGEALDAEFHFVHTTEEGQALVIGVLARESSTENEAWQPFIDGAAEPGTEDLPLDVAAMLPTDPTFEEYTGSLTTPPCTEGVEWVVYHEPIELSAEQIAVLRDAYDNTARPTQLLGDRVVYEGTIDVEAEEAH